MPFFFFFFSSQQERMHLHVTLEDMIKKQV